MNFHAQPEVQRFCRADYSAEVREIQYQVLRNLLDKGYDLDPKYQEWLDKEEEGD